MGWFRKRIRKWRRARATAHYGPSFPTTTGVVTLASCHPAGERTTPVMHTVFRQGSSYRAMADVEIRGFLDGDVKFARNVATQYHVRMGCEGSKPERGRYEVMRVLQRWELNSLPESIQVKSAHLTLFQEDIGSFPHRYSLRWPVDFYLYEVKKPWNPGRGGEKGDNLSPPEPGDAWWKAAMAGKLNWSEEGCSFASDTHPDADRGEQPLAWARLKSARENLVFSGPRLTRHIERACAEGKSLDFLIAARPDQEALPGTIRAFYSAEYGDDFNPEKRPQLEVSWTAPASWSEEQAFLLQPGESVTIRPQIAPQNEEPSTLCASLRLDGAGQGQAAAAVPEVYALDWLTSSTGVDPRPVSLQMPVTGRPGSEFGIRISGAVHPIPAGEEVSIDLLETWAPSIKQPEDLQVLFRFTAPSRRSVERSANYQGDFRYVCQFLPDEMGVWSYSWKARPDVRFAVQTGEGHFTVVRGDAAQSHEAALQSFTEAALRDARSMKSLITRRRTHFRLVMAQREIQSFLYAEERRGVRDEAIGRLRELLLRIRQALPKVD